MSQLSLKRKFCDELEPSNGSSWKVTLITEESLGIAATVGRTQEDGCRWNVNPDSPLIKRYKSEDGNSITHAAFDERGKETSSRSATATSLKRLEESHDYRANTAIREQPGRMSEKPQDSETFLRKSAAEISAHTSRSHDDTNKSNTTQSSIYFPTTPQERKLFRTKSGKVLTPHQWAVYDFILTIPKGKVSTYKGVSLVIGGSPRSVGTALRNNPFAPFVPCHRVIASNLFIGGFMGEWAGREGKESDSGKCASKRKLLEEEGVTLDSTGFLKNQGKCLWIPDASGA